MTRREPPGVIQGQALLACCAISSVVLGAVAYLSWGHAWLFAAAGVAAWLALGAVLALLFGWAARRPAAWTERDRNALAAALVGRLQGKGVHAQWETVVAAMTEVGIAPGEPR